ncbi:MAG TPA: MOSC domain-containing protein [Burkholderiales bacterium]
MRVSALAIYPVKGGAATALDAGDMDALGLAGDRRYCLARPGGRAFTQRDEAALARLRVALAGTRLTLVFDGDTLAVDPGDFSAAAQVHVWGRAAAVRLASHAVNAALTRWFGTPLQLARLEQPVRREAAVLAFGDAAALLVANSASLDALNAQLEAPVPMNRFRPNIVVSGGAAFAEDGWARLRIGAADLVRVHDCGRCEVTTIDQEFGAVLGSEPLATLARTRLRGGEPVFGVRYCVERPGRVRVGDPVEAFA